MPRSLQSSGPGGGGSSGSDGRRRMSQTTAVLLAALIGVFGGLSGLLVERFLRSFGRLWCEPSEWDLKFLRESPEDYGSPEEVIPAEADMVEFSVHLDLFNGKEIPVGLRDISIVLTYEGGELVTEPLDTMSGTFSFGRTTYATLYIVNLSPRQWIHIALHGGFAGPDNVRYLAQWKRAEFVGQRQRRGLLESKTYRKTIATASNSKRSWWGRWLGGRGSGILALYPKGEDDGTAARGPDYPRGYQAKA